MKPKDSVISILDELHSSPTENIFSFKDYLELVSENPGLHFRNAAMYIKDCMDYFGTRDIVFQGKKLKRFRLFDAPFDDGKNKLVGQEEAQNAFYALLEAQIKQNGSPKLMLLHGPNGSAKTTFFRVLMRALEEYSRTDEGKIFRFNWIFPSTGILPGGIGFGKTSSKTDNFNTYAYLDGTKIDALFPDEFKDHPLLLIPKDKRPDILRKLAKDTPVPHWLEDSELHPRNRKIFDAMFASSQGGLIDVFKHIQVERFFFSRRYRSALVTVEPKMAVDAHIRQITSDRSLSSLPPALQNHDLYRYSGDLIDANRGLIEFSDLFKKPVETFKYLINTLEEGFVNLDIAILKFDLCFTGSVNDRQLAAFTESAEFASFEGRTDFVKMPYLLNYHAECEIYENTINTDNSQVAPYTFETAAIWAVMTRLVKPQFEDPELGNILSELTVYDKALLYGDSELPKNIPSRKSSEIKDLIPFLSYQEISPLVYEGGIGASPRLINSLILKAASNPEFKVLSPMSFFAEAEKFMKEKMTHEFLNYPAQEGGFHDTEAILEFAKKHWEKRIEKSLWQAAGLIEEAVIIERFENYIELANHYLKKEKIKDPLTGKYSEPSEKIMRQFEQNLDLNEPPDEIRQNFISRIGAFKLDNPDAEVDYAKIFASEIEYLNKKSMKERKQNLLRLLENSINKLNNQPYPKDPELEEKLSSFIQNMYKQGYEKTSLSEAIDFYYRRNIEPA